MALVMLPCDLPWWGSVQKQLKKLANTKNTLELIEGMQKIHDMCNISLDPDEDTPDPHQFVGLLNFLDNDVTSEERSNFLNQTLPSMATRASNLRQHKPKSGLHFSLQQQPDCNELEYELAASLVANAFFSTYPKRTDKTHPTLQNFNFSYFFKNLVTNSQKAKLKSILHYFDWLSLGENAKGKMKISRQVMSSKEWLTIEDWLECNLPLCPVVIKHEGKLERTDKDSLSVCFSSTKLGGRVLENGNTQESICMACVPELLAILLHVESLEDNEVVTVERVRRISRIVDPKNRATLEKLREAEEITMCCVDAEDYSKLPLSQYEEDNVLRELNKCLLAFQQKQSVREQSPVPQQQQHNKTRRLSPIGESISLGSNSDQPPSNLPIITQESCSTTRSGSASPRFDNNNYTNNNKLRVQLEFERGLQNKTNSDVVNNRRGRFIVLGSSGECLPVKRNPMLRAASRYSSFSSSDEEFHSAKTSVEDDSEEEEFHKRYSLDLQTPERRHTFAERLKDALRREASSMSTSTESSYAVGINVTGSGVADPDIKVKRKGSTGFMLQEDSLDEDFLVDSLKQEKQWIDKFRNKQSAVLSRKESNKSSEYSFSTDYSSELEEVYEQFSRWLEDPILQTDKGAKKHLDGRDLAVVQFAGSILKRTLSESFAGVPLVDGDSAPPSTNMSEYSNVTKKNKMVLSAKSLSLELAKHKHLLAAQLLSQIAKKPKNGLRSISTGNWGCGSSKKGEVQLKVIIQWLAASVSGVPSIIYYTSGHGELASLDTVYRILRDRKWTVKDLADATLRYSARMIEGRNENSTLFDELIGVERNLTNDKRNQ